MEVMEYLQTIRQHASITKITQLEPETETWINQEYAEQDIDRRLRGLANRKAHGCDGIPGKEYNATRKWEIAPITRIVGAIKTGHTIPENWTNGTIVYIYKNRGETGECGNYRPICLKK